MGETAAADATWHQAALTAGVTLLFPLARWLLHDRFFKPIGYALLQRVWQRTDAKVMPDRAAAAVEKTCESMWKLLVYALLLCLDTAACWRQPWLLDTQRLWEGWPQQPFTPALRVLYNVQLGFYVSSIGMILCWEVRRKDFAAMFTHHLLTLGLIVASWRLRFWRAGAVMLLLHDPVDALLEAAKILKYSGAMDAANGTFAAFVAAWLGLRLVAYPLGVLRSTLLELPAALASACGGWRGSCTSALSSWSGSGSGSSSAWMGLPPVTLFVGFNAALLVLLILHVYWAGLILRVVVLALATGSAHDVREDEDDEVVDVQRSKVVVAHQAAHQPAPTFHLPTTAM